MNQIEERVLLPESRDKVRERTTKERKRPGVAAAVMMLIAVLGAAGMGSSAVALSSGEALALIPLYLFGTVTAFAVRFAHRRDGMVLASVCAALGGLSVILGPVLIT